VSRVRKRNEDLVSSPLFNVKTLKLMGNIILMSILLPSSPSGSGNYLHLCDGIGITCSSPTVSCATMYNNYLTAVRGFFSTFNHRRSHHPVFSLFLLQD
jgi:hypothetical protein